MSEKTSIMLDPKIEKQATKVAHEMGYSLDFVINAFLKALINAKKLGKMNLN